ncbi:WD repeat protein 44 [Pseudohyphozyma bogoriensis]|nr:WD repeat protein 44 [Pseudohyphozyma bogoriensis]
MGEESNVSPGSSGDDNTLHEHPAPGLDAHHSGIGNGGGNGGVSEDVGDGEGTGGMMDWFSKTLSLSPSKMKSVLVSAEEEEEEEGEEEGRKLSIDTSASRERQQDGVPSILVYPSSPEQEYAKPRSGAPAAGGTGSVGSAKRGDTSPRVLVEGGAVKGRDHGTGSTVPSSTGATPKRAPTALPPPPSTTTPSSTARSPPFQSPSTFLSFMPSLPSFSTPSLPTLSSLIPKLGSNNMRFHPVSIEEETEDQARRYRVGESVGAGVGEDEAKEFNTGLLRSARGKERGSMDLRIEEATANGETFSDAVNSAKPQFPPLQRKQSAAFIAASQTGKVNPMTMQAIARKGSETEAMKVFRDREERERKWSGDSSSGPTPALGGRQQSWTAAQGGARLVRSESPTSFEAGPRDGPTGSRAGTPRPRDASADTVKPSLQGVAGPSSTPIPSPMLKPAVESPVRKMSLLKRLRPRLASSSSKSETALRGERAVDVAKEDRDDSVGLNRRMSVSVASPASISTEWGADGREKRSDKGKEKEKVKFIKTKSKNKAKEFNKLFLAQELFIPASSSSSPPLGNHATSPSTDGAERESIHSMNREPTRDDQSMHSTHEPHEGASPETGSATSGGKKKNAVWTMKWSVDGKYLAVGGKDGVVRIWEVLATSQDRINATSYDHHHSTDYPETPRTPATPTTSRAEKKKSSPKAPCSVMPVFGTKPLHEFKGHEADVLDLSWSKNNFLLSSSMDKTVRLWHVSRSECLCAFQHLDFVTSIAFHPKDDRFFLSGSLDCKLRLWNIPEKRVHLWTELPELITSVAFTSDGKLAIAGSFTGICMFFDVDSFRYHAQFAAKSTRGKNSKGRKITSMISLPVPSSGGERLLVTSNDSRMRLYHIADKAVEMKYAGHENTSSQIRASFSDDARFIISGSEDRHVYIWESGMLPKQDGGWHFLKKKDGAGHESFQMSANIITCASFAPSQTREVLAHSNDPIFGDGGVHLAPLRETLSGAPLSAFSTATTQMIAVSSNDSMMPSTAEDSIVVVADDTTGVISVLRNSSIPKSEAPLMAPKLGKRRGSRSPSEN